MEACLPLTRYKSEVDFDDSCLTSLVDYLNSDELIKNEGCTFVFDSEHAYLKNKLSPFKNGKGVRIVFSFNQVEDDPSFKKTVCLIYPSCNCDVLLSFKAHIEEIFFVPLIDRFNELLLLNKANINTQINVVKQEDALQFFPKRKKRTNKGSYKRVLIIGGSRLLPGGVYLSSLALSALSLGSGYACLACPDSMLHLYQSLDQPEVIYDTYKDENGYMTYDKDFLKRALSYDVIAIGMGLGVSENVYKSLVYLLSNYNNKLLIDADGLNSLSKFGTDVLKEKTCDVYLTPHMKEFERLTGVSLSKLEIDPFKYLDEFVKKYDVNVDLKSCYSYIANKKEKYINISGTPALAKGGSGDVLSGIAAGLLTKGVKGCLPLAVASLLLGKTSEHLSEKYAMDLVNASDVCRQLKDVVNKFLTNLTTIKK